MFKYVKVMILIVLNLQLTMFLVALGSLRTTASIDIFGWQPSRETSKAIMQVTFGCSLIASMLKTQDVIQKEFTDTTKED